MSTQPKDGHTTKGPTVADPQRECRRLLAQLELISHAPTARLDKDGSSSHGKASGGNRPPGGIVFLDDLEGNLKSHIFYRRRYQRCKSPDDYERLAGAIQKTLDAWRRTPPPPGGALEPEPGTFAFKRMIANSDLSIDTLKRRYRLSVRTIYRYRAEYGTRRAA